MKLTIVIPALNEEQAIASIIERTLGARERIVSRSAIDRVEIIVVSDGSTDRTAEIATQYQDVRVIVFKRHRGYGAAIKKGFEESRGELVGFLDADGTCDPNFFADLANALLEEKADVALGSRMTPVSKMPPVRRLGNRVYAFLLSAMSNRVVTDTASGMRVIRRDVLGQLEPLPDGLNFTPAMTARVLMDDRLSLIEKPMPYEERIGTSKLHVIKDGVRFLRTIFQMTLMWQPARIFVAAALVSLTAMTLLAAHPLEMWLTTGHLREDMIYRLLFCSLLGMAGVSLLSAGVLCHHLRGLLENQPGRETSRTFLWALLDRLYCSTGFTVVALISAPMLLWLTGRGAWTWVTAGYVDEHWSRFVLAGLITFGLGQMLITVLIANLLRFHGARKSLREASAPASLLRTRTAQEAGSALRKSRDSSDPQASARAELPVPESGGRRKTATAKLNLR